ncbi:3-ketoacyl-CoA thiolase @ Acetyl-CoA acetyltransferase, FadA2, partial [hydrothermal vent metagenome]
MVVTKTRSKKPDTLRRVAIIGSKRAPFCRSYSGYSDIGNLTLLSTAIGGLVDAYGLKGEKIDEVMAGAVIKHSRDFNLAREASL